MRTNHQVLNKRRRRWQWLQRAWLCKFGEESRWDDAGDQAFSMCVEKSCPHDSRCLQVVSFIADSGRIRTEIPLLCFSKHMKFTCLCLSRKDNFGLKSNLLCMHSTLTHNEGTLVWSAQEFPFLTSCVNYLFSLT